MKRKVDLDQWLKSGLYLPQPLRDFHDQKDVFKAMHEIVQPPQECMVKRPNWIDGQCYVIDVFLWFMARRGWTLQRTRVACDFRSLEADVSAQTEARNKADAQIIDLEAK